MTFYDHQAFQNYQHYQCWAPTDSFDYEPCPQEFVLKSQSFDFRNGADQPIQRYLNDEDRLYMFADQAEFGATIHPLQSMPVDAFKHMTTQVSMHDQSQPLPSPTQSGASSYVSSSWSDTDRTPYSSPDLCSLAYTPDTTYVEASSFYPHGGQAQESMTAPNLGGSCVALHDVQTYADAQPEKLQFEEDTVTYASYVQEGYQPTQEAETASREPSPDVAQPISHHHVEEGTRDGQRGLTIAPVIRRRRPQTARTVTTPFQPSKVTKRTSLGKRTMSDPDFVDSKEDDKTTGALKRSFACPLAPYGCTSTFGSKNEWKRHCQTQHMRLGFWRCDLCPHSEKKPNDFNRKDLFIQHVRRMHFQSNGSSIGKNKTSKTDDAEEKKLAVASQRCYITLRAPPFKTGCVFCEDTFEGPKAWDDRMEHVGRHLEAAKKAGTPADPSTWNADEMTEEWLRSEGLIIPAGRRWILADGRS
ncbi:Hypothetical protein R9X50_00293800 [Acrodontium crateriforme]|uniref:Uncharacterized protein n=1 Tax=Acrodontium crateriforme TaxID=150365 RepID=A0AAQ3M2B4_9PEZI|nr:Hypothetical protein R9X50_00293800 [Acrodontium crateriforme]